MLLSDLFSSDELCFPLRPFMSSRHDDDGDRPRPIAGDIAARLDVSLMYNNNLIVCYLD